MVRFIVDSTFGLTKEFAESNGIKVVSLSVTLCGKQYKEGYAEQWNKFYSDYSRLNELATTSQPAPYDYMEALDAVFSEDPECDVIILTIGDRLSGAIGSANIAAHQYPDKRIEVIDTQNAATASRMFLDEMLAAAQAGASIDELLPLADSLKLRLSTVFVPARLTELKRGGRVNKLISRIGSMLNIKPVLLFAKNDVSIKSLALGFRRAVAAAVSGLPKKVEKISVCYISDDNNVPTVKDGLFKKLGLSHIDVAPVSPVLGAHIGLGTVGISTLASV